MKIGELERSTQTRVVKLFRDALHYQYLGNLKDHSNENIRTGELERIMAWQVAEHEDGELLVRRAIDQLHKAANDTSKTLYDRNHEVYSLLRYGAKVKLDAGALTETLHFIDWKQPERNEFAIAEEVSVTPRDPRAATKRPDIVVYVNGIALAVLELKRSTVSVSEGIRQNLDNQKKEFIQPFFSTMQLIMAGNDPQGLRYGAIQTPERYYLTWKEQWQSEAVAPLATSRLDQALVQLCDKRRLLQLIHDFVAYDRGTKKLCRHNQYFGVCAAQEHIGRREGGIIWHTQGSGKSLTMVWLARWILENVPHARVLIITDRTELDEQIEGVFHGVGERSIYRTTSGKDLIAKLNTAEHSLLCSLIHKFGSKTASEESETDIGGYIRELEASLTKDFKAKGDIYLFVDECHRTQSGLLHEAMKRIVPDAVAIGFTGTPLLKADKKQSIKIFGGYIHSYKFHEAVSDGVVLDLRYEARDVDQRLGSRDKIDEWFEIKTRGLTQLAKAQLKVRWGTMQKVLSSQSRLDRIVADILMDMEKRDRLRSGRGNAMLVAGSIYEACKFYELFVRAGFADRCAIVTSYVPKLSDTKGEETGEGATEQLERYNIYRQMLAEWFSEPADTAIKKVDAFEIAAKEKFIKEPGQMKLLIVVDKLLTGFDAPSATYLYIDKRMRDHGLFQAICRVNRLDGDDKEYGYIVDYKDLFRHLKAAVRDYTTGPLSGYEKEDVEGLLQDRLDKARNRLDEALESMRALCEPVQPPRDKRAYYQYFSSEASDAAQLRASEPQRLALYQLTARLVRAYAAIAGELLDAGYTQLEATEIEKEVKFYEALRREIQLHSGDSIDLKAYEPAMRHLIDSYIRADDAERVSNLDDLSLVQLVVQQGARAVEALPEPLRNDENAAAETIENNVRRLIIDETPVNPRFYERMSLLLDALVAQRRNEALSYRQYLDQIVELTRQAQQGPSALNYPEHIDTPAKRALYDNLDKDGTLVLKLDQQLRNTPQDDWRNHPMKTRRVESLIADVLGADDDRVAAVFDLVKNQDEY